jgi:dTDP-4-dehydrorhamnose reductase
MRILVTGTSGQLAQSLIEAGLALGADVVAMRRPQLDLTLPGSIRSALADAAPDVVVNAAAYTAVDRAETEEKLAHAVNAGGAGELALQCARRGAALIHVSTDYVFDGTKPTPYLEDDPPAPLNAYGRSKLAGEKAVAAACARHLILRTSWIYSPFGTNFVRNMLRLGAERAELAVVDDQVGCPTYAPHLARAVLDLASRMAEAGDADARWGIYHAAGAGETSWHGLARDVFDATRARGLPTPVLKAIPAAAYPTAASRPANSRLACDRLAATFGLALPDWRIGVRECLARLLGPT